jgi:hypothetical protein
MPPRNQLVNEVRADEAGSAGDKSFHNAAEILTHFYNNAPEDSTKIFAAPA